MTAGGSRAGLVATAALHAAVLGALLAYEPARSALAAAAAPIMVDWIAAPKPEPVIAPPEPPKPKPVHHRPKHVETPKVIAAPVESPSPSPVAVAAPPPPPPPQQVAAIEAPAPAPEPVVVAPIFNAAYLQNPKPPYPGLSRKMGERGEVVLRVLVNTSGGADQVTLQASSGFPRLDEAARETVRSWKFVPAKRGSEPVAAWVLVPIIYSKPNG